MFSAYELSLRLGRKRHLFVFMRQGVAWRFVTAGKDVTVGGNTYLAAGITRSEIKETIEKPQDQITITFPYTRNPNALELPPTQSLGDNWHPYMPNDKISVVCMAYHSNDPDAQTVVEWQGQAATPKYSDKDGTIELICVPNSTVTNGLNRGPKCQRTCWKSTYSTGAHGCNLNPAPLTTAATVTDIDGLTITAAEFADAPFDLAGGEFSWVRSDGIVESRPIMTHAGTTIQILYFGTDLAIGTDCTVLPDCEHDWDSCNARGNTDNHGGALFEPVDDPYNNQSMSWSA